jgi:hypothetical protein
MEPDYAYSIMATTSGEPSISVRYAYVTQFHRLGHSCFVFIDSKTELAIHRDSRVEIPEVDPYSSIQIDHHPHLSQLSLIDSRPGAGLTRAPGRRIIEIPALSVIVAN